MKKNTTTWVMVALVIVLASFYIVTRGEDESTLDQEATNFSVSDTAKVKEVRLALEINKEQRQQISLTREEDAWRLNGKYGVVPQQIQVLLKTLKNIEVREPVHPNAKENYLKDLRKRQIRVDVVSSKDGDSKTFFVGGETPDKKGTIMLMKGAEDPYIVEEPGVEATLFSRFLPEFDSYQEKIIFNVRAGELQQIDVRFLGPDSSFTLMRKDSESKWQLKNGEAALVPLKKYLSNFRGKVYARAYAEAQYPTVRDSLKQFDPNARLTLRKFDGKQIMLHLYERRDNINEYWGWRKDEQQLMRIQRAVIDKFLVPKRFFRPLDGPFDKSQDAPM
ncbi:MAG: DUF4340 domain-containing protein [Bacteroidota bacterium]